MPVREDLATADMYARADPVFCDNQNHCWSAVTVEFNLPAPACCQVFGIAGCVCQRACDDLAWQFVEGHTS